MSATPTKADFLGLGPGDYTVTLNGSSTLCGGSVCTGTVHIGASGATGFDWNFVFPAPVGQTFDWDTFVFTNTADNCAIESNSLQTNLNCFAASYGGITPTFVMYASTLWNFTGPFGDFATSETWSASPLAVPEPATVLLYSIGVAALWIRRRFQSR